MTNIYYCKNEEDLKRIAVHIFSETAGLQHVEQAVLESGLYRCDYNTDEECDCCENCEHEECLLYDHLQDKDVHKHIKTYNCECEFPCIVCLEDTECADERITYCSLVDAKYNTKHGCE